MTDPSVVLLVRFKSSLTIEEVVAIAEKRAHEFRDLEGLIQKYYLQDLSSGEYVGLYLWDSSESLARFRESELRSSIAEMYRVQGEPRVEVLLVLESLRSDGD